jgi:hypothetical protein
LFPKKQKETIQFRIADFEVGSTGGEGGSVVKVRNKHLFFKESICKGDDEGEDGQNGAAGEGGGSRADIASLTIYIKKNLLQSILIRPDYSHDMSWLNMMRFVIFHRVTTESQ